MQFVNPRPKNLIICPICYGKGAIAGTLGDPHATD